MNRNLITHSQPGFIKSPQFLDPVMRPVASDDVLRPKLEAFISSSYKQVFNAKLKNYLPNLVAATSVNDEIQAAFGYCDAGRKSLFLESYLDKPIETLLSQRLGCPIKRQKIVEVGNLSITRNTNSVKIMRDIASHLQSFGYEWIVCTATRYLRMLFIKSGSRPIAIAQASQSKVNQDGTDWGNYYATPTEILVGNINQSLSLIEQKIACGRP